MKGIKQLGVILVVCLMGEWISGCLPIVFPGSVMGMLVMLALLASGIVKLEQVEQAADFLVGNMAILFIPLGVGVIGCYDLVAGQIVKLLAICVVATLATFSAAAAAAGLVMRVYGYGDEGARHE